VSTVAPCAEPYPAMNASPLAGTAGAQGGAVLVRVGQEERAVLRVHQRGQLAQDQVGDLHQVAVALHQRGEPGQVGLQPVLRAGRLAEVGHHQVDVVLQLGDLALCLHRDRAGHVALGHRRGHLGDRADLGGEVRRQLVHVRRQALPGAVHALHPCLAAELALGADLAGHAGDLGGEGGERVDHRVDGGLQLQDLAARVHVDLLREVALATAVATWAMFRTCEVRLSAM
jgi:hypothetical protein